MGCLEPRATDVAFGREGSSDSLTAMAEQEITTLSLERYAPDAKALIVATQGVADASRHAEVTPLHLLSQCLGGDLAIQEVFRKASVSVPDDRRPAWRLPERWRPQPRPAKAVSRR